MAYESSNPGPSEMPMAEPSGDEYAEDSGATTVIPVELTAGQKFNPGDEIVLEVLSTNEDGSLVVKYATGKGDEDEEGESWESDFRKEMSPREPTEEAM